MHLLLISFIIVAVKTAHTAADAATDFNHVNNDGSFAFGLSNNDIGGHYHQASGDAKISVNGRFGSRNAETGRVEETVYTAGPRGFRPQGPSINRRFDLSQVPGPKGTLEDPEADPYEDPSYSFDIKTLQYKKQEAADSTGRVRGEYSYLDDIGEQHVVKYDTSQGFEVTNAVPDSPASVGFRNALYKSDKFARGKISFEKGPGGQYTFLSSGPDQRRSESTGSDGITRGSYSYLDDKGLQRTVEYIAGPGIGYRVVSSRVGSGTHLLPSTQYPSSVGSSSSFPSLGGRPSSGDGSSAFPSPSPFPSRRPSPTPASGGPKDSPFPSTTPTPPSAIPTFPDYSDYYPTSEGGNSAFLNPAYTDVEGLRPPNIYNPYEGAYQNYGILSSTASTWAPSYELSPPFETSFSPTTSTFAGSTPSETINGYLPSPSATPPSTAGTIIATVVPVSSGWKPAMVINVDLLQPGRAPSPGEKLAQEMASAKLTEKVTNCSRGPQNEFSCTVKEQSKTPQPSGGDYKK